MNELSQVSLWVMEYLPSALAALAILIIGWLLALLLASVVRSAVGRTKIGATLVSWLKGEEGEADEKSITAEQWAGKITFYLAMFFVLIAFFQFLGLTFIAEPLRGFLSQIFDYAPRILGAVLLLLVAWLVASLLKMVIIKVLTAAKIDERFGEQAEIKLDDEKRGSLVQTLAAVVYWLVFLFFLPAILSALALEGLLVPVQNMFVVILGFLPNILGAAVILLVGWIGARILQRLGVKLMEAFGVDRIGDNANVSNVLGEHKISRLVGVLVYALVIIFAVIAALNALALEAITAPASNMLGIILEALPAILAAALILFIAYLIGKLLSSLASNILASAGFNNILQKIGLSQATIEGRRSPAEVVGFLVLVAVMLFAAIEASSVLGFGLLADLITQFTVALAKVAVGLVIFGIALYLAGVAQEAIMSGGGPHATILGRLAKISILVLAGAMALSQMGIAQEIIVLGFGILLGAIALTVVVALGIGGRDIAARELEQWLERFKSRQ